MLLPSAFLESSVKDEALPEMKKPPRMEAARACRSIWSRHRPEGSASDLESGITMVVAMFGALLIMVPF